MMKMKCTSQGHNKGKTDETKTEMMEVFIKKRRPEYVSILTKNGVTTSVGECVFF